MPEQRGGLYGNCKRGVSAVVVVVGKCGGCGSGLWKLFAAAAAAAVGFAAGGRWGLGVGRYNRTLDV